MCWGRGRRRRCRSPRHAGGIINVAELQRPLWCQQILTARSASKAVVKHGRHLAVLRRDVQQGPRHLVSYCGKNVVVDCMLRRFSADLENIFLCLCARGCRCVVGLFFVCNKRSLKTLILWTICKVSQTRNLTHTHRHEHCFLNTVQWFIEEEGEEKWSHKGSKTKRTGDSELRAPDRAGRMEGATNEWTWTCMGKYIVIKCLSIRTDCCRTQPSTHAGPMWRASERETVDSVTHWEVFSWAILS